MARLDREDPPAGRLSAAGADTIFDDLPTPAALIDLARVERNLERMRARAARLGVRLRPHVKTHKCVELARLQTAGQAGGITVSTLAEARAFASAGFRDITWALPLPLGRIDEALELAGELDALHLLVDHPGAVEALEAGAARHARIASVFLKLDCGYHRAGVDPADPASLALARRIAEAPHLSLAGILTHAGHSYAARDRAGIAIVAAAERDVSVAFAARLRTAGVAVPTVSVGSTPTLSVVEDLRGIDEARPGNYVFYDWFQTTIGSCTPDDVALFVLTSVIGRYPERDTLIVDAGALALSKDAGPRHVTPGCGYGAVHSLDRRALLPELELYDLSQEHGKVRVRGGLPGGAHPLGERLLIAVNHSCLTAALHPVLRVVRGAEVVGVWRPVRGW